MMGSISSDPQLLVGHVPAVAAPAPPVTPAHRFPPMRPRVLLPLVVGALAAAAALSSLVVRLLRLVGVDLGATADDAVPVWYPDESVAPGMLPRAAAPTPIRARAVHPPRRERRREHAQRA